MLNWLTYGWLTICAVGIVVCVFLSLRDRRLGRETRIAEAERAAKAEAQRAFKRSTTACIKCGERLPKWFVSKFEELGGNICLHCETGGFEPLPEPGQTEDDYVTKRKARHAALPPMVPPKKDEGP